MNNFTYYTPTKVVFGRGSEGQTGALVRERGCKKVLLHYGCLLYTSPSPRDTR